jgi:hypothetical protein
LPIGNLNSQFFANVYLNGLDQFVKHELRCRHYLRYCDDFVLLAREPDTLAAWRARIDAYLRERLHLEVAQRQWLFYVDDMIRFATKVLSYTEGIDQASFQANDLIYDATLRNLELIGEAATHVPEDVRRRTAPISRGGS